MGRAPMEVTTTAIRMAAKRYVGYVDWTRPELTAILCCSRPDANAIR